MEEKENKKKRAWSLLKDPIQLRFYKTENFEQIGSMELSPRSIYILFSSLILILLLVVFSLLAFTPLQRLIPRLSNIENSKKFIELSKTMDEIDASLESQELYLSAFRRMLVGDENVDLSNLKAVDLEPSSNVDRSPERTNSQSTIILPVDDKRTETKIETGSIFDDMETVNFVTPLSGLISASFEPQKKHFGVDIIAPSNSPIGAVYDGYIIVADWSIETGHTIGIQHDHNILSFYKHNSVLLKEKGNFVKAGEIIAIIGNSGKLTSGPHLHFELWHNGKPVNPNDYIKLN